MKEGELSDRVLNLLHFKKILSETSTKKYDTMQKQRAQIIDARNVSILWSKSNRTPGRAFVAYKGRDS